MAFFTNLLNLICYLPLLGALVIIFVLKREQSRAIKTVATARRSSSSTRPSGSPRWERSTSSASTGSRSC
jgi:hypothetical protein